jgi:hypothetical protein
LAGVTDSTSPTNVWLRAMQRGQCSTARLWERSVIVSPQ